MKNYRIIKIPNGDRLVNFYLYECSNCGCDVPEDYPHCCSDNNTVFCWDCGFRLGIIDANKYVLRCGVALPNSKAAISPIDGAIEVTNMKYFSWERAQKKQRNTPEYIKWRTEVFTRDNFTCQICGQVGCNLNAHHIKSFAKHKKLRTELSNGITLCEKCHRRVHKGVVKLEQTAN